MKRLFKICTFVLSAMLIFINIPVFANGSNTTVEGDTTRFVTGDAYASQIEFTGYNVRTKELYFNFAFTMTNDSNNTLNYFVNIYDETSKNIANLGTTDSPVSVTYTVGDLAVSDPNKKIILNIDEVLTAGYRTVVTVKDRTTTN